MKAVASAAYELLPGPDDIAVYSVPEAAPPGFAESIDVPRLEAIVRDHERLWVSYGAIHWADPEYSVSRWLAENTFCVYERAGMSLCLRDPDGLIAVARSTSLAGLSLQKASVDGWRIGGDPLRVRLDCRPRPGP